VVVVDPYVVDPYVVDPYVVDLYADLYVVDLVELLHLSGQQEKKLVGV
jgi:hypothetical protein